MTRPIVLATCARWPALSASDECLAAALCARGWRVEAAPWNGPFTPFAGAAAVVIRSTWDYHEAPAAYLDWLAQLDATRTFNPPALVRWNLSKAHVLELGARGARVPRSLLPGIEQGELAGVFFDGVFSHGARRVPAPGEFRVNAQYGGRMEAAAVSPPLVSEMAAVLALLPASALYARVDGVVVDGRFVVSLGLDLAAGAADRFAQALLARLA